MNSPRKHALVAGVLYIISFVSIPTCRSTPPCTSRTSLSAQGRTLRC
jgi:hypothetical protein